MDARSFHGGCPVVHGTKWAANLWVWNKVRFLHFPAHLSYDTVLERVKTDDGTTPYYTQVIIQVNNQCDEPLRAMWENTVIITVPAGTTRPLLSYESHQFTFMGARTGRARGNLLVSESNGFEQEITFCGENAARAQARRAKRK
jgi:prolyl 4-hydroxylase